MSGKLVLFMLLLLYNGDCMNDSKIIIVSENNPSISKDDDKCINCGLCKVCCKKSVLMGSDMECIYCGQCILSCPVGAIKPKYEYPELEKVIKANEKLVIGITSPAVRVSLGEAFNMKKGLNVEGKLVNSLRKLGFDYVFDTTFGADLNTLEEANELLNRIDSGTNLPLFSSCCPSWVKYVYDNHRELIDNISTCKSPIAMLSTIIKEYFSKVNNLDKKRIVVVAITPCTSKKYEKTLYKEIDYVITTSELAVWLKEREINFPSLRSSKYDKLFPRGSSSGVMYGSSGGVTLSILRTINYMLDGNDRTFSFPLKVLNGYDNIKTAEVVINNKNFLVAVIYTMPSLEKFLESGEYKKYHFIEVMNCDHGCVGGGGQVRVKSSEMENTYNERAKSLNKYDKKGDIRYPYKNKDILDLYSNFLMELGGDLSLKLLHTTDNLKEKTKC